MAIVILIIFILVIGGMFGLAIWKIRQTNPNNVDTSLNPAIDTTQGFLSFEDIKDGVIDLGIINIELLLNVVQLTMI